MKKFRKGLSGLLAFVMALSAMLCNMAVTVSAAEGTPTIWIVGDSTSCDYKEADDATYYYKRVGFGTKLKDYVQSDKAKVENLALSGRSSKSFLSENNYKKLMGTDGTAGMQSGDYLIIAFGHNDEKQSDAALYTSPGGTKDEAGTFKNSLYENYIKPAQNKGVTPVLCTPIVRHPSGSDWTDKDVHKDNGGDYAQDIKELAIECSIDCIDLTTLTKEKYTDLEAAKKYHAWINEKTVDNTHLNNYGAKMVACLIAKNAQNGLKDLFVADPQEPTEEEDLKQNPGYQPPKEGDYSLEELETNKSSLWTTTKEDWYATVFGDVGGAVNKNNFDITETPDENKVQIVAGKAGDKGKVSSSANGIAMYFTCIPANTNIYQVSAKAHINSINSSNDQVSFGAIISDEIKIDTNESGANFNYVAAGPVNMSSGKPNSSFSVDKATSTMTTGDVLPAVPAAGDEVTVKIVKYGNRYATSYKTPYGNFIKEYTLSDEQMSGYIYPGFFAARNADITFTDIVANGEATEPGDGALITRLSGKVTYTGSPENGSVTLVKTNGNDSVSSGTQVDGETELKLTATPNDGNHYPSVKVGTKELVLDNNSYTWKVDGDVDFTVEFPETTARTAINEGKIEWTGENNDIVQQVNQHLSGPYYFELEAVDTNTATLDTANKRINIGSKAGIKFSTGDLVGKEAYLTVSYATSGDDDRNLMLKGGATDVTVGSTNGKGNYVTNEKKPVKLEAGKTYSLVSNTKAIYVNKITVDVKAQVQVTPSFKIDGTDPVTEGTYTINGQEYTVGQSYFFNEGEYPLVLTKDGTAYSGTLTVTQGVENPEVTLTKIENVTFKGTVTVQGKTEIPDGVTIKYKNTVTNVETQVNFDNSTGAYEMQLAPGTYEVEASELEGYTISTLSSDEFTVSASDTANNFNNVLYKKNAVPATASNKEIYVDPDDTSYDGVHYPTVNEAIAGIKASSISSSATDKWTVRIKAGTYREQIIVDANNVTLTSDYNGNGNFDDGEVTLTWYYGVGYKYYSIKPVPTKNTASSWSGGSYYRGLYDIEYAYDKHNLTATVDRWGTAVQVTGDNFYAEGITFENSFNRYMTQDEIDDGVTLATAQEIDANKLNTEVVRTIDTDVKAAAATERAAALVLDNAKASIYKCKLKSSQDTLYVKTGLYYFKDCEIMGQTDYIFGGAGSFTAFDNCKLLWSGYNALAGKSKPGYITATQGKIILRDCSVESGKIDTSAETVEPGYYGRPWGTSADVTFINTKTNGLILEKGWNEMSGVQPEQATFKEYGNTTTGDVEFKSTLNGAQLTKEEADILAAENDYNFYSEDWLPEKHVPYVIPEIEGSLVTWNFKTRNTSLGENGAIQSKTGTVTVQDDKLGTVALNVDATSGKLQQRNPDADAQFNENTKITIPVYQAGDIITINAYDTQYSVKDKPAESATTEITAEADDVGKGIDLVATGNTYLYSISLRTLYEPVAMNTYEFDFVVDNLSQGNPMPTTLMSKDGKGILEITNFNRHQDRYGATANNTGVLTFTMAEDADTTEIILSTSYEQNKGNAVVYVNDVKTIEALDITTTDSTNNATANATLKDLKAGDIVKIKLEGITTSAFYSKGLTVKTTGALTDKVKEKKTITWNLNQSVVTDLPIDIVQKDTGSNTNIETAGYQSDTAGVSLYVDTTKGGEQSKFQVRNQQWAIFNDGAVIKVPVFAVGDEVTVSAYGNTTLTINGESFTAQSNGESKTVKVNEDKDYIEIVAGSGTGYLDKITLTTTGEIPEPAFVFKDVVYNDGNDTAYVIGEMATNASLADASMVGINAAMSKAGALADDASELETDTVFAEVVDEGTLTKEIKAEGDKYIAAIKVPGLTSGKTFYVSTYSEIDGHKVYGTIHEETVSQ